MKAKGCVVYVENMKGDFYQVALKEKDENTVLNLVQELQGTITVIKGKEPLKRVKS